MRKSRYDVEYIRKENNRLTAKLRLVTAFQAPTDRPKVVKIPTKPRE